MPPPSLGRVAARVAARVRARVSRLERGVGQEVARRFREASLEGGSVRNPLSNGKLTWINFDSLRAVASTNARKIDRGEKGELPDYEF